jgi:phospholipid/cholesterol/gamma-HCH transport system ATP-binding protein
MGGSGSGKTVLLRLAAGLIKPDRGRIETLGVDITPLREEALLPVRRRMGFVFQSAALFDSLTVYENVAYPLREHANLAEDEVAERVHRLLARVGLREDVDAKLPAELSGGMRKRAALARALALDPDLLFLDEPTSGLDPISAGAFDELIRDLSDSLGLTVFMITHDLDSLYAICDRVAVIADKKVVAAGTIAELKDLDHPWIQEYFNGPRGRLAAAFKPDDETGDGHAAEDKAQALSQDAAEKEALAKPQESGAKKPKGAS